MGKKGVIFNHKKRTTRPPRPVKASGPSSPAWVTAPAPTIDPVKKQPMASPSSSFSGCGVGSVPESLLAGTTLFYPDRSTEVPALAIRARAPHLHLQAEASPHSTSAAIPIKSSLGPPAAPRRSAAPLEEHLGVSGLGGDSGPHGKSSAHQVKIPTLGQGTAPHGGCPRRNTRQVHPGPFIPPRFSPIQDTPPSPEEHGTVIVRGFDSPGKREVKKEPVLEVEDDPIKKWQEYRAVLAELREKYARMKLDWKREEKKGGLVRV
ncbi:hypothetical protein SLS60_009517 [Paraconiothyrium brasiliense]|uniref:Uncharacterized protein n=1 Tax=Paraconiothyrium brasiliense TaxID=300254 RepID=A0ABR3QVM9_9PLEO